VIYNRLGRTELRVSAIGIGTGGPSRLGLAKGNSAQSAENLIRFGLDKGINIVDSAPTYGTEPVIGAAIRGRRSEVVVSTKAALGPYFGPLDRSRLASRISARLGEDTSFVTSGTALEHRVEDSLRRLGTDYIDIVHLHTVTPGQYEGAFERLLPTLLRLKSSGKVRWIGITEHFERDPAHRMLALAAATGAFDCIMIGFNYTNSSGLPVAAEARRHDTGIMAMFAVRGPRSLESLQVLLDRLAASRRIDAKDADADRLLRLLAENGVTSLPEAAIRFCQHELGPDIVLSGSGDRDHLAANIAACEAGPLPEAVSAEFHRLFSGVAARTP
jgi:aryl-alcohol dehydrogenase-like predicted oxidoreductase